MSLALLTEAVRTVDQLDELHAIAAREGLVVSGPHGSKAHPAVTAAQHAALARIVAALRLPAGDEDSRGVIGVRSAGWVSAVPTASRRVRDAAAAG